MFGCPGVSQQEEQSFRNIQISFFYFPHLPKEPNLKGLGITQTNCRLAPFIKRWEASGTGMLWLQILESIQDFPVASVAVYFLTIAYCRAVTPEGLEEGTTEPSISKNLQMFYLHDCRQHSKRNDVLSSNSSILEISVLRVSTVL